MAIALTLIFVVIHTTQVLPGAPENQSKMLLKCYRAQVVDFITISQQSNFFGDDPESALHGPNGRNFTFQIHKWLFSLYIYISVNINIITNTEKLVSLTPQKQKSLP